MQLEAVVTIIQFSKTIITKTNNIFEQMSDNSKISVLIVPSDRQGVGHFRSIWTAQQLFKSHKETLQIKIDVSPDFRNINYLASFDIIHFHRQLGPYEVADELFAKLKEKGVTLVMDIDDYWSPPPTHPLYEIIKKEKLGEKIEHNLTLADWVTTTTDIFAKRISKYNKNVVVIPNCVNPEAKMWKSEAVEPESDRVRVAWIGGSCYDDQTEILTDEGYKFFKDLTGKEKVATLNPENNQLEFHKPNNYIAEPFKGKLQCGKNSMLDYAVTPNHKMLVNTEGCYQLIESRKIFNTEFTTYTSLQEEVECDFYDNSNIATLLKVEKVRVSQSDQFEMDYDGVVYCVNVKHNIVYVRRNGKTMWCGNSHLHDLFLLKDSMELLREDKELKDKTQIVMCGFDTRGTMTHIDQATGQRHERPIQPHETIWMHFERIFTDDYALLKDDPEYAKWLLRIKKEDFVDMYKKPYVRRWTLPLKTYAQHYDYCDVCLAPLVDTYNQEIGKAPRIKIVKRPHIFNEVKSELKVIEAGVKKKALIAQDFGVYSEKIIDGVTGILVKNNKKGWYNAIKKVVEDKVYRDELANNLHNWVMEEYSIDRINGIRAAFYEKIMEEKNLHAKIVV